MAITKDEKNRRAGKKAFENLDQAIAGQLEDPDILAALFEHLREKDPKRFFDIVISRMPKVPQIDQDLQKTYISLKEMMESLPDVEDIIGMLHKAQSKIIIIEREKINLTEQMKMMQKKLIK